MNKAAEQYLYQWGQVRAKDDLMEYAYELQGHDYFIDKIRDLCKNEARNHSNTGYFRRTGRAEYCQTIIRLIENNVITDWPSFVTFMTGETYEKEEIQNKIEFNCHDCVYHHPVSKLVFEGTQNEHQVFSHFECSNPSRSNLPKEPCPSKGRIKGCDLEPKGWYDE